MTTELTKLEPNKIADITDNYRHQGYQVLVKPRGTDLREFMSNQDLDFIIHSDKNQLFWR